MFASYVVWGYYISVNQTSQHVETIDNATRNGELAKLTIRKDMLRVTLLSIKLKTFHFGTSFVWSDSNIVTTNSFVTVFLRKPSFLEKSEWKTERHSFLTRMSDPTSTPPFFTHTDSNQGFLTSSWLLQWICIELFKLKSNSYLPRANGKQKSLKSSVYHIYCWLLQPFWNVLFSLWQMCKLDSPFSHGQSTKVIFCCCCC